MEISPRTEDVEVDTDFVRESLCNSVLIPMKVVGDSDLIPVAGSDAMAVTVGAQRRWHSYGA